MSESTTSTKFRFIHDPFERLVLIDADGEQHVDVEVVRAFPLSDPNRWLSIRDVYGKEILFVEDMNELSPECRASVEEELSQREFLPIIQRVKKLSSDCLTWEVVTDRGPTEFHLNNEDDVRRMKGSQYLVIDADGVRFLIPDVTKLDSASRKQLDRVL